MNETGKKLMCPTNIDQILLTNLLDKWRVE